MLHCNFHFTIFICIMLAYARIIIHSAHYNALKMNGIITKRHFISVDLYCLLSCFLGMFHVEHKL